MFRPRFMLATLALPLLLPLAACSQAPGGGEPQSATSGRTPPPTTADELQQRILAYAAAATTRQQVSGRVLAKTLGISLREASPGSKIRVAKGVRLQGGYMFYANHQPGFEGSAFPLQDLMLLPPGNASFHEADTATCPWPAADLGTALEAVGYRNSGTGRLASRPMQLYTRAVENSTTPLELGLVTYVSRLEKVERVCVLGVRFSDPA